MAKFLSQAWFDQVNELNQAAGTLKSTAKFANVLLNAKVTGDDGAKLHLKEGKIFKV